MKDLNPEEINEIIKNEKSVILIWAEGCKACDIAKDYYNELAASHVKFNFYKMKFSHESLLLYNDFVKDEVVAFPSFLVFDKRNIEESNKYGFVGNVNGLDMVYLEMALESIGA